MKHNDDQFEVQSRRDRQKTKKSNRSNFDSEPRIRDVEQSRNKQKQQLRNMLLYTEDDDLDLE